MKMQQRNSAFTLIELMVAIAIIGILAAVVLVSLSGQRDRAKGAAALMTAKSVMPGAADCALRWQTLNSWNSTTGGGNKLCNGSDITWPTLDTSSTSGCVYGAFQADPSGSYYGIYCFNYTYEVRCAVTGNPWTGYGKDYQQGNCVLATM